jgi:hypothetical protein
MVTNLPAAVATVSFLLAAQQKEPVLERLDPPRRVAVVMALLALVLTGLVLVTCAMIGARWVRRMARHKPGRRRAPVAAMAAENQRLREALDSVLPEAKTDDTMHLGRSPGETKLDH